MLTISSLGGPTVRCVLGKIPITVFPVSGKKDSSSGAVTILSHPEEQPSEGTISWPGEYDFSGIFVRGIGHDEGRQVSYVVDGEDVRLAFLSSPLHKLSDFELEQIGDIDVLCVPVDDVKMVQELIDAIDPRVLVPLPTKDERAFNEVLKVCGAQGKEAVTEHKIKGSLPAEGREVVVLKATK
jgi:L-ascorbate metabolism protein UlaG (beta-lactamase superfamily)